jgi:hypothetical protein
MVLAHAEEVDPGPVGEHRLVHDVADHLGLREQLAGRIDRHVPERVQAELEIAFSHRHFP